MKDNYEHRRFDLPPNAAGPSKEAIHHLLQPIGDDAWEITYVGAARDFSGGPTFVPAALDNNPLRRWIDARRPSYGTPGPSSWEYTGFNIHAMPEPSWSEHLASRGWQKVPGEWYSYHTDNWYVFKRTDVWRGTDDGDIAELLNNLGFNLGAVVRLRLPWRPDDLGWRKSLDQMVQEILDTKWQLSMEAEYDVGIQRAVESWRSNQ
jgi:hypothetical protein